MNKLNRIIEIGLHLIFLVLFVLSILHYKERLFADSAYFFFHAVNGESFHIEHQRLLLGFSQIFPVLGSWFGLPLKYLLLSYSLGLELLYYLLFLFLTYVLKDKAAAWGLILVHLIGQLWLFYVPSLESSHAAAMAIVLYAVLKKTRHNQDDKWLILLLIIEWLVLFAHPANMLFVPLLIFYDCLQTKWRNRLHSTMFAFFAIALFLRFALLSTYDQANLEASEGTFLAKAFSSSSWSNLFEIMGTYYPDLLLLVGLSLVSFALQRTSKKVLLFLASLLGFALLIQALKPIEGFFFFVESSLIPLVFVGVFFFVFGVFSSLNEKNKSLLSFLLLAIVALRVIWIVDFGHDLEKRKNQLNQLVDQAQLHHQSKFLIQEENFKKSYSLMTWANPIEVLLFSAIDGAEAAVSIVTKADLDYGRNKQLLNDSSFVLRMFDVLPYSKLNKTYFQLQKVPYKPLNTAQFNSRVESLSKKVDLSLLPNNKLVFRKEEETTYLSVKIQNTSQFALPSLAESGVFIACHWYKENGELYKWDGKRNLLEVDVLGEYQQDIEVNLPSEKGIYYLQPDLVIEGKMWFELKEQYRIEIL